MSKALKVLHVEDSEDDAELVCAAMEAAGYKLDYLRVENRTSMLTALQRENWDVVISDFSLPKFDGWGVLETLQATGLDIPFIIVSGCIGEEMAVDLMKAGAHDYVMKDRLARLTVAIDRELQEAEMRRRKRLMEKELIAKDKLLHDMAETLGEGLLVLDGECRLMFMNAEAESLLGWTEAELAELDVRKVLCPAGTAHTVFDAARQVGVYRSDDEVFIRKDGAFLPVSFVTTPIVKGGKVVATVTAFHDITLRKQAENELQESRRQLQALAVYLQSVREEERKRIARELHDELGQTLTALRFDLNWLEKKAVVDYQGVSEKLTAMVGLVDKTVNTVRRISEDLRPGMLDDLGLAAAIEHHVEKFGERTGISCELSMSHEEFGLGGQVETAVFRLLQESLTNVARHAQASRVAIRLQKLEDEILLIVQDNGQGLPTQYTERRKTYGLLGMHERVKLLGGGLEISSEPGKGTRVEASIPMPDGG